MLTVKDLLLFVPLRYEDKSQLVEIDDIPVNQLITLSAEVINTNNYYKGPRSIQSATITDGTGKLKVMWFNNRFILDKLKKGHSYYFSGKINNYKTLVQPTVEDIKAETLHTNRLVPIYSHVPTLKQGTLRRILKHTLDGLNKKDKALLLHDLSINNQHSTFLNIYDTFNQLHFPDATEMIVKARERLAIEELLALMQKSQQVKEQWKKDKQAVRVSITQAPIPKSVPFTLTNGQHQSLAEILADLQSTTPMNRLLVGDVGSGKTVVAGIAAYHVIHNGRSAALVAPTRILAEQHYQTLQKIFPELHIELILSSAKSKKGAESVSTKPSFYVGTHAVINKLNDIQPGLLIYDEQHRFGVAQRSASAEALAAAKLHPHVLTMSATPIPRSMMLTVFSHLSLSVIDELPSGRLPTKTWVVPESKRSDALSWVHKELSGQNANQALIVCPFIDPSNAAALENVAAVTERYVAIHSFFANTKLRVALLHGRMKKTDQADITTQLYNQAIDILVTTPIVEVGVDLPAASIIVIEAAERFGLASLHQLRGRVGRAGQQGYCLLFTNAKTGTTFDRLQQFSQITSGSQVAELDLANRGAGDIFGTQQHGFDELKFANWANVELISEARHLFEALQNKPEWKPLFKATAANKEHVLAN